MGNNISVKEAKMCIDSDAVVIDVRTAGEHSEGHIEGSVNIDIHSSLFEEQIEKLDKAKNYIVHCVSGGRSREAVKIMLKLGFKDVHNLAGGITRWKNEGMSVVE